MYIKYFESVLYIVPWWLGVQYIPYISSRLTQYRSLCFITVTCTSEGSIMIQHTLLPIPVTAYYRWGVDNFCCNNNNLFQIQENACYRSNSDDHKRRRLCFIFLCRSRATGTSYHNRSSESSGMYCGVLNWMSTRQYIPEDSELHIRRHENLKSHLSQQLFFMQC
jgi:hypothetical protein